MTQQIPPNSPLAENIYSLFRTMGAMQRDWQDQIGFGEEGSHLRAEVAAAQGTIATLQRAESNLRNYYHAKLDLIVTEVAEAVEELRYGRAMDETYYIAGKPEGVPSELADVVIRVWSLIGEIGIDLGPSIVEKLNYNATRAQRHGGKAI